MRWSTFIPRCHSLLSMSCTDSKLTEWYLFRGAQNPSQCSVREFLSSYTADHPRLGSHGKSAIPCMLLPPPPRRELFVRFPLLPRVELLNIRGIPLAEPLLPPLKLAFLDKYDAIISNMQIGNNNRPNIMKNATARKPNTMRFIIGN